jgi:hypothetical protein
MTLPNLFYAEPQFHSSSPALAKLETAREWTLDTPGIEFALAFDYYRVEAFATKEDRDAACGPTEHEDVRYVPSTVQSLRRSEIKLDEIACGYRVDHPRFEEVVSPLFDAALRRLIEDLTKAPRDRTGVVASVVLPIARARYTISAESTGDWIRFPVEAIAAFEKVDQDLMDQTVEWLNNRLILKGSAPSNGATAS